MKLYEKYAKKISIIMLILAVCTLTTSLVMASDTEADEIYEPANENQYLELRAVEVKDVTGQNKQVIMELWGHDIDFKRI